MISLKKKDYEVTLKHLNYGNLCTIKLKKSSKGHVNIPYHNIFKQKKVILSFFIVEA
jgi:hypothetical protein